MTNTTRALFVTAMLTSVAACSPSAGPMSGSGALPTDCRPTTAPGQVCQRPSNVSAGAFGAGPSPRSLQGFSVEINGGFVDTANNRIVVGVSHGTDDARKVLVMGYDLTTGNRTVISGIFENPSSGVTMRGAGPAVGFIKDIRLGPDGKYYALNSPDSGDGATVLRIDPATGDRTLVWAGADAMFGQCPSGLGTNPHVMPSPWSLEVEPSGSFLMGFGGSPAGSGLGVLRVSADGRTCSFVTLAGRANDSMAVGGGVSLMGSDIRGLYLHGGALYATHGLTASLLRVDLMSGMRTRVASSANQTTVGTGGTLGVGWVTYDPRRMSILTTGQFASNDTIVSWVDSTSGNRNVLEIAGPAYKGFQNGGGIWVRPSDGMILMAVDGVAIVAVDPETGNSNIFSI
jgi:hypothetical protein